MLKGLKPQKVKDVLAIKEYKEANGCAKCGETKYYMLDFHHRVASEKEGNINHFLYSKGTNTLWREVEKCLLLCRNHHQEFHHFERTEGLDIDTYLKEAY